MYERTSFILIINLNIIGRLYTKFIRLVNNLCPIINLQFVLSNIYKHVYKIA